jgi:putative Mg2+ transporter-C (MgtC) family protein
MFELMMLGRVALAIVLCAVIGVEREFRGRPAGLRTHLLVGGGAALIMVVGVTFMERAIADPVSATSFDIGRLIAGVVTGIGFLGAGTIIRQGDWVLGLTTAASVWFVAGIGITAGLGFYILASGATVVGFLVLFGISRLEAWMPNLERQTLVLELPEEAGTSVRKDIERLCGKRHVRVRLLSWETDEKTGTIKTKLLLTYWRAVDIVSLANKIRDMTGAISVEVKQ